MSLNKWVFYVGICILVLIAVANDVYADMSTPDVINKSEWELIGNSELVITKYDGVEAETYLPEINGSQLCLYHKAGNVNVTNLDELRQLIQEAQDNVDNWTIGIYYSVDDLVKYNDLIYKVLQSHTSQSDWTPNNVPALFVEYAFQELGEVPQFVQPTGGHDAYNIGDRIWFEVNEDKLIYESLINANVWSPTAYPKGWKEIGIINEQEVYGNESITAINELGNSVIVPRNLEEGLSTYCVNVTQRIQIGENTIIAEWVNNTFYLYPTSKLELQPFTIEVLFDNVKQEYPDINWTSDEPIDVGIPFELRIDNFTQRDNITFRQNKLTESVCEMDNQFYTTCKEYKIDFTKFESLNNITNKTIKQVWSNETNTWYVNLWDSFLELFGVETAELIGYDITYYGNITNLDPSLEYTFTSTEYGFYNQTEGSNLGVRTDAPVLFMNFNNAPEGTYVQDNSLYNNYGTTSGSPTYNSSCSGRTFNDDGCMEFDGSDDYVGLGNHNSLNPAEITVSSWVKFNDFQGGHQIFASGGYDGSVTAWQWRNGIVDAVGSASKDLEFFSYDGTIHRASVDGDKFSNNIWYHLVGTYDGSNWKIFVNGEDNTDLAENEGTGPLSTSVQTSIGAEVTSTTTRNFFNGSIDQVQIWDRALSADEILELYNGSVSGYNNSDYIGKYSRDGDFKSLVFYNDTSTYWNTTLSLADSNGSAGINSSDERLIFYYPLDGNYDDATGNYPSTATPGTAEPKNSTGISSGALDFSLNSREDRVYSYDTLDPNTEFTGCSWVFHHNLVGDSYIFELGDFTDGFLLWRDAVGSTNGRSNSYKAFVADYSSTNTAEIEGAEGIAPEDEWVHICYTYISDDSEGLRLYINGVEDENSPADTTGITTLNAEYFYLGCSNAGCSDALDEYLFYNTSLTPSEIQELYKAGLSQHANTNITLQTRTADSYNISDSGLVGFWSLNSNTSGVAVDETGNNNGTWEGGAMPLDGSGVVGMGGEFDGVDDYISLSPNIDYETPTGSVNAWFYLANGGISNPLIGYSQVTVTGGGENTNYLLFHIDADNKIHAQFRIEHTMQWRFESNNPVSLNNWYNAIIVHNGISPVLYLDGEEQDITFTTDIDKTLWLSSLTPYDITNLDVGSFKNNNYDRIFFNGSIDEVRIYNRSLSADEIQNLYELGSHHIEWNEWQTQEKMTDLTPQGSADSGNFFQYRSVFNTNDTDVSSYILNYSVGVGSQYGEVTDTTPPTLSVYNITEDTETSILADFNATDSSGISYWWINDTTNFKIDQTGQFENNTILSVNIYSVNVSVNDTVGNIASEVITVNITAVSDTTNPTLNILYPTNQNYTTEITQLNYTASDDVNLSGCWYSTDGGTTNSSFDSNCSNFTGLSGTDGSNTWTVYANDTSGNVGSDTITFYSTYLTECYSQFKSGLSYTLNNDINNQPSTCFTIGENNVTFNGLGHTIDGQDNGQGISIGGASDDFQTDLKISNFTIKEFWYGVRGDFIENSLFENLILKDNDHLEGLKIYSSDTTYLNIQSYNNVAQEIDIGGFNNNNKMIYNNSFGEIYFKPTSSIDVEGILDFGEGKHIQISDSSAYLNGTTLTELNKSANISLYNMGSRFSNPTILKNGEVCPEDECYNFTSLDAQTVIFNVTYLAYNYTIGGYPDNINPQWKDNSTNLTSQILQGQTAEFNITFTDDYGAGDYIFSWYNGTTWVNDSSQSWINNTVNTVIKTIPISSGYINWTWYFDDAIGNNNQTDIWSQEIVPIPIITINYPVNGNTYTTLTLDLNGTVTNGEDCWYSTNGGTTNSSLVDCTSGTFDFDVTGSEGSNTWTVYANYSEGYMEESEVTFTIDLPPVVSITKPLTGSYQDLIFPYSMTCSDTIGVDSQWYEWEGTNYTYTGQVNLNQIAGDYSITAYCNDTIGSLNSVTSSFSIVGTTNITDTFNIPAKQIVQLNQVYNMTSGSLINISAILINGKYCNFYSEVCI